jgi:hypothetical protein
VVDDITGEPVSGLRLQVFLPDGKKWTRVTFGEGEVALHRIESGMCKVTCSIAGLTLEDTVAFMGTGDSPIGAEQTTGGPEGNDPGRGSSPVPPPRVHMPAAIVELEEYHVKKGDTRDSIASSVRMSWRDLAVFNWGVSSNDAIEKRLHRLLGCNTWNPDDERWEFDDQDAPGILYLPKPWILENLPTEREHVLRVRFPTPWLRILYQIDVDDPENRNDLVSLEIKDLGWHYVVDVATLNEIDADLVELLYPMPPRGVPMNLVQDPGEDDPVYVFHNLTLEELCDWEDPEVLEET